MPDISKMALLFAMEGTPEPVGDPPTDAPSNMSVSVFGSNKWRVHWDNGDPTAYTRAYFGDIGSDWEDSTFLDSELPGVTSHDTVLDAGDFTQITETADDYRFFMRHFKNGVLSDTAFVDSTDL